MQLTVALPEKGALVKEIEALGCKVVVGDVCKIKSELLNFSGIICLLREVYRSIQFVKMLCRNDKFDVVYSNSIAVVGGALGAKLFGLPHVWHIREIQSKSKILTFCFRHLVSRLSNAVICNSNQTMEWIRMSTNSDKYRVVWNGFDAPEVLSNRKYERAKLGFGENDIIFIVAGRINRWKGQKLLIEAFAQLLINSENNIQLFIVGSAVKGQEYYEHELVDYVKQRGCEDKVVFIPFNANIDYLWAICDVAVVPSIEPEPFGRVAIEAMGFGLPVIAAAHGGLLEIVADGETGLFFQPGNVDSLLKALSVMTRDKGLRLSMGKAGKLRQQAKFSLNEYTLKIADVLRDAIERKC